jgi:hypothetical protein
LDDASAAVGDREDLRGGAWGDLHEAAGFELATGGEDRFVAVVA